MIAPTLADSTADHGMHWSAFLMRAATAVPVVFFDSPPDSGYSLDNLAPAVPAGFAVGYNTGSGNQLSWDPCPDEDFKYFCVYRSSDPHFVPSPAEQVHTTTGTSWSDPEYDGWNVHYKMTSVDFAGNESEPSSAGMVTGTSDPVTPGTFALHQNVPNPFNPVTVIRYEVPAGGGQVTLGIYDVAGKLVRTLVDGFEAPGENSVIWDARGDREDRAASGVYFCCMTGPGFKATRKIVLLE